MTIITPLTFSPPIAALLQRSDMAVTLIGGGGWLGQASLAMLDRALGPAFDARVTVYGSRARSLTLGSGRIVPCRHIDALKDAAARPTLVLHYAFLTKDRVAQLPASEFIRQNEAISDAVDAYCRRLPAGGLFLPSSGAVYRKDRTLDDDLAQNPYGVLKVRDESRFLALGEAKGLRTLVCRVFNLAGPFVNKVGSYALSSILLDIARGGPITLRAAHPVIRSYFYIRDLVDVAVGALLSDGPLPNAPFDTAGEEAIEVGDLAARAAAVMGAPGMIINRPPLSGAPPDLYVGDAATLDALMEQLGIVSASLDEQIAATAAYLADQPVA